MAKERPKITICIPAYNNEKTIVQAVQSAQDQVYPKKKIVVFDDGSTDRTVELAKQAGARVVRNKNNLGIGKNLEKCFNKSNTKYIIFLCADDIFADEHVVMDVISIFHHYPDVDVIGRFYYQFDDGDTEPVAVIRDMNILTSSCNPSGMAFKRKEVYSVNTIFIEMPFIVRQYLIHGAGWTIMEYDTIGARLHKNNTAVKEGYYDASPFKVWSNFLGNEFKYHQGLIQLKNRAPKLVWREIQIMVKTNPKNLLDMGFLGCAVIAILVPGFILRPLTRFYRTHINSLFCTIKKRPTMEELCQSEL